MRFCSNACRQKAHRQRHPDGDQMNYADRLNRMVWDAEKSNRFDELATALRNATQWLQRRKAESAAPIPETRSEKIKKARRKVQDAHPDRGGNAAAFQAAKSELDRLKSAA